MVESPQAFLGTHFFRLFCNLYVLFVFVFLFEYDQLIDMLITVAIVVCITVVLPKYGKLGVVVTVQII